MVSATSERRLEVKSHSDEILKEVKEYFEKYPNLPEKPSITPVEKDLKEQVEFLEQFIKNK